MQDVPTAWHLRTPGLRRGSAPHPNSSHPAGKEPMDHSHKLAIALIGVVLTTGCGKKEVVEAPEPITQTPGATAPPPSPRGPPPPPPPRPPRRHPLRLRLPTTAGACSSSGSTSRSIEPIWTRRLAPPSKPRRKSCRLLPT